jgi:hypothetical protein
MSARPLAEVVTALVECVEPPPGSGLAISAASLDVPLEGRVLPLQGAPVFCASLPHTRWQTGFLPPVQMAHLELGEPEG